MKILDFLNSKRRESGFIIYFRTYLKIYEKKDRRVIKQAFDRYLEFIKSHNPKLLHANPSREDIISFIDWLISNSRGSGAASTYARFRKVMRSAVRKGVLRQDPSDGIRCPVGENALTKDILSDNEIRTLLSTKIPAESSDIRKAFIFSLYTGLRFCDIRQLTYRNIDFTNRLLILEQSKTKGRSSRSVVHIPLREDIMKSILPGSQTHDLIFKLPSHPTCMKYLKEWTAAAGINKHITWHCARHSFATNILKNGADIRVVADLLGHSGLKYVEIYTRAIDERKTAAVNSLPNLP